MKLEEIRDEIDKTDEQLLALFLRRMELGRLAAEEKLKLGRPLQDSNRERHILNKVSESSGPLSAYSERLFQELMALSRSYQSGLFEGKGKLAQKVSEALEAEKSRQEVEKETLNQALLARISLPDLPFSPLESFGKQQGLERGLLLAAALAGLSFQGKSLLILTEDREGSLHPAFEALGASSLRSICPRDPAALTEMELEDTEFLINTSPSFSRAGILEGAGPPACGTVLDLCSMLHRSPLLQEAEEKGWQTVDGLALLALSLAEAEGLPEPSLESLGEFLREFRRDRGNIVIVGMPGSGKSAVAQLISRKTGRRLVNLDSEIIIRTGKSIPAIFAEEGEGHFRMLEREAVCRAGALTGAVIATGGGTVKDFRNYGPLHSNGRIYYLRRAVEELDIEGRPLSKDLDTLRRLEIEREPLYCRFADADIQNDLDLSEAANRMIAEYAEYYAR